MQTFKDLFNESLKNIGSRKVKNLRDPIKSFKFSTARGLNRKNLKQVPVSQDSYEPESFSKQVGINNLTNNIIKIAKKSDHGVWRIPLGYVKEIARKYHFIVPNEKKRAKHLGSTGIQAIFYRPGVYYLYKKRKLNNPVYSRKEFLKQAKKRLKGFHKFKED